MNHLNEDKLIQYAFDLMEPKDRQAAARHLDDCAECRAALKQLQAKFAAMETLAEEVPPSDELIRETIINSVGGARPTKIPLYRRRWVEWSAAAAAVVLICALFLQNLPETKVRESKPSNIGGPSTTTTVAELDAPKDNRVGTAHPTKLDTSPQKPARPSPDDRMAMLSRDQAAPLPNIVKNSVGTAHPTGVRILSADQIPDKAPFAPASAIELVVLPKPDKTQVTIYNSADLTLVRDTRKLTLKPGWNWLQFMWDQTLIDPTSLSLTPLEHADKIDVQQLVYPARLNDIGRWLIRSEVEGAVPFEITYFASGLSWRAFYMGTMNENETAMDLKGYVNVANNSGQDFENTQTRLVVGQTHLIEQIPYLAGRYYPYGPDVPTEDSAKLGHYWAFDKDSSDLKQKIPLLGDMAINGALFDDRGGGMGGGGAFGYEIKAIEKEGLSEYFLYTIEGTEDLPNTWAKRLPSFDVKDVPVKSLYKYDEDRYGMDTIRFVSFKNDAEHELGETPIPEGSIKIYRNVNEQQNLSYIGQSDIKYIPVNEDVELNLGTSPLVKIEPTLMDSKTDNYTFNSKGDIDGWDEIETWQMKLTNTREIPIDIEITRNFGMDYWDLTPQTPADEGVYKKHDKSHARFTVTLPPRSEKTLGFTVTKYQQRRSEYYVKKSQEREK